MQNLKKIVGLDFEKFDQVYFRDRHADIQTDTSDLIGPLPFGGPKKGYKFYMAPEKSVKRIYV